MVRLVKDRIVSSVLAKALYVGVSRMTRKNLMFGKSEVRLGICRRSEVDLKRYGVGGVCEIA